MSKTVKKSLVSALIIGMVAPALAQSISGGNSSPSIKGPAMKAFQNSVKASVDEFDSYVLNNYEKTEFFHAGKNFAATVVMDVYLMKKIAKAWGTIEDQTERLRLLQRELIEEKSQMTKSEIADEIKDIQRDVKSHVGVIEEVDGKPVVIQVLTEEAKNRIAKLEGQMKMAITAEAQMENLNRIRAEINYRKNGIKLKLAAGGTWAKRIFISGVGGVFVVTDLATAGLILVRLERDPKVLPVISLAADESGLTDLTEEFVLKAQDAINAAVELAR